MSRDVTPCCNRRGIDRIRAGRERVDIYSCDNSRCSIYGKEWCDLCGPEGQMTSQGMNAPMCPACGKRAGWQSTMK